MEYFIHFVIKITYLKPEKYPETEMFLVSFLQITLHGQYSSVFHINRRLLLLHPEILRDMPTTSHISVYTELISYIFYSISSKRVEMVMYRVRVKSN